MISPDTPPRRRYVKVRQVESRDFPGITALCNRTYPNSPPWSETQLSRHLEIFPEGQLVAVDRGSEVVGYAASLIVFWDDYEMHSPWKEFTDSGMFTNHDPAQGRTLYGAEVMVHPEIRGSGIGGKLYEARRALAERLGLLRIRAGARLRGFHKHAAKMSAEEYVRRVTRKSLRDPTLSFQINRGFHVLAVVPGYLKFDPESLGWAAVIEWLNPQVATPADRAAVPRW
ncbi:MAG: GNAT family N-acetyltransferase [Gemmatimonadaceae bacterium]|nr:GNAT family N-acetyltransferase [Gemmatimonadaceae bacterium]MCW5826805.1 GNAT family N-acetyltransferase [Gemmatimonadaceae bacterium]